MGNCPYGLVDASRLPAGAAQRQALFSAAWRDAPPQPTTDAETPGVWRAWDALRRYALGLLLLFVLGLQACATTDNEVWHSFQFNGKWDGWSESIDLLAFDYGGKYVMVRDDIANPSHPSSKGLKQLQPAISVNGPMPVGEYLYVKWRVRSTGQVVEQRVDLRQRLPADMRDQKLTFVIEGTQLYVYIVTNKLKDPPKQELGLKTVYSRPYLEFFVYEIYPSLNRPRN